MLLYKANELTVQGVYKLAFLIVSFLSCMLIHQPRILFNNEKNKGLLYVQGVYTNCTRQMY